MAIIRAMAIFQGGTNVAEDRFINTFHFANDASYATHRAVVDDAIHDFYTLNTVQGGNVAQFLSPFLTQTYEIRTYDMSTGLPRVPTIESHASVTPVTGGVGTVPEEVACCLSYRGAAPVTARRRGRIYIGPLNSEAVTAASSTTKSSPKTGFKNNLIAAADRLRLVTAAGWCVYSPTDNAYVPITGGWVDNAFDTMRKRGPDATIRYPWGATL